MNYLYNKSKFSPFIIAEINSQKKKEERKGPFLKYNIDRSYILVRARKDVISPDSGGVKRTARKSWEREAVVTGKKRIATGKGYKCPLAHRSLWLLLDLLYIPDFFFFGWGKAWFFSFIFFFFGMYQPVPVRRVVSTTQSGDVIFLLPSWDKYNASIIRYLIWWGRPLGGGGEGGRDQNRGRNV